MGDVGRRAHHRPGPERIDCFWLLRYGVSFRQATVDDLVLVGPGGRVVEGEGPINMTAYYIHGPVHDARPEAVSVAHTPHSLRHPLDGQRAPLPDDLSGGHRLLQVAGHLRGRGGPGYGCRHRKAHSRGFG